MRQRRWLELLKDYDCEPLYHPRKANVVANALSRKEYGCGVKATFSTVEVVSSLIDQIKMSQSEALLEANLKGEAMVKQHLQLTEYGRGLNWRMSDLLLEDAHKSNYVERCKTCLQVKEEHQQPYGSLQSLEIPECKWEHITMDESRHHLVDSGPFDQECTFLADAKNSPDGQIGETQKLHFCSISLQMEIKRFSKLEVEAAKDTQEK
ncbi:hypothetical protein L6452_19355 [Arctium lappa]|uniref:Uncharacterized protein n=1 Tax=Arctium lappa TaxID=4217 RepID=A0ACB9B9Q5_ARCLA|nr:hypothetical protein L6452_19355 [Arctium lappa]